MEIVIDYQVDGEIRRTVCKADDLSEGNIDRIKKELKETIRSENEDAFIWFHSITYNGETVGLKAPTEAENYWKEMYLKQQFEAVNNDCEMALLKHLAEGKSITESIIQLRDDYDITATEGYKVFEVLKESCNDWEKENMLQGGRI